MAQHDGEHRGVDERSDDDRDDGAYFAVEVDRTAAGLRIVARGELDAASAPQLAAVFQRESRPGRAAGLDLGDLTFIDSSGLRVVASELRRYEESDTAFSITAASEPVRRILMMTGLGGLLEPTA